MPNKHKLTLTSLGIGSLTMLASSLSHAATLEVDVGLTSSRYLDGINLTDDQPTAIASADLSFDNGLFSRLDCHAADSDDDRSLRQGCDLSLGYFTILNEKQALSFEVTQHEYSRGMSRGWDFTEFRANWHVNTQSTVSVTFANDWLRRGFNIFSLQGDFNQPITDRLNANFFVSASSLDDSNFGVSQLFHAKASLQYSWQRWSAQASIIANDSAHEEVVPFDVDQPALNFTISYKLY